MVTMQDIAEKAGVSTATVSRVLNDQNSAIPISPKTRDNVLNIAKQLGYTPNMYAKTLRTKRSMLIGVIVWDLTDFFFSDILRGIENALHPSGYNMVLNTAEADVQRECACLSKIRDLHVDGILLVGGSKSFCIQNIDQLGIKPGSIVLVGTTSENMNISSVTVDNYKGGYNGAEYLLSMNMSNYLYIAGTHKTTDMEERLQGVRAAVQERTGTKQEFTILDLGPGESDGYHATVQFLENHRLPVGIFAVNDITALGVIRAVEDSGLRIPEDVAILGFDDLSISNYLKPSLSTIHQPRYEIGEKGVQTLLETIEHRESTNEGQVLDEYMGRHIRLDPELVIRESS
jgi:DNA-binding LacI/PurR family transcriptional regulator